MLEKTMLFRLLFKTKQKKKIRRTHKNIFVWK